MKPAAPPPAVEAQRLARLRALAVQDTEPEPLLERFARLAAQIAGTPIALVSLVDAQGQWIKAQVGLPGLSDTPREHAFCAQAVLGTELLEVRDASRDARFADNPLVTGEPGIRFYAGAPLTMPDGERLGALCVIDRRPRQLGEAQRAQLTQLADAVVHALMLRERTLDSAWAAHSAYETELSGHVRALSSILDRLPMAVSVWDRELRNAYANVPAQQRVGRSAQALLGQHLSQVIGRKAFAAHRAHHEAVLSGEAQLYEASVPHAEGPRNERVQLVPLRNERGAVEGYVALVQDVDALRDADAAQRALVHSERKFRTLSEASPVGVFHTDAQGLCTYTNERWQSIYGLTLEQSLGEGWSRSLHPDDRAEVFAQWQHDAESGHDFEREFRVQRPDGSVRQVRSMGRALRDEDGSVTGFVGTVEDVTDARAAQTRLRESEAFLDRTGRVAGVGGWEYDMRTGALFWSDQTCRVHEVEPGHQPTVDEAIGYYAPEARLPIRRAFERALREGTPYDLELPMITAKGRRIQVRAQGEIEFRGGRPVRAFGTFQDITRRHEAELALRQLYEQTPAMVHSIDVEGTMLSVSDLWLTKLGYTRDEVIGRPSEDFFAPATHAARREELERRWQSGSADGVSYQMVRRDGQVLDVLLSALVQRDAQGRPLRSLAVIEDVTELQREQALRRELEQRAQELKDLLAERSEMLDVLAHEVRQPLNNASAALQSASAALADTGSRHDALARLQRAQSVMHAVMSGVDNTLAVASLLGSAAEPTPADIDADIDTLLAVAVGDMPAAERERVRVERVSSTRTASLDMGLTRLALRNLLANALRYSPPGSPVTLRVSDSDEPLALVIDVIDQGPGIQTELLPRLFERGTRGRHATGRPSHGLGLYIVRRVLELQGGRAEVLASGPGGTTMRLWLAQCRAADSGADQSSDSGARKV